MSISAALCLCSVERCRPGTTISAPNAAASNTARRSTSPTAMPSRWSGLVATVKYAGYDADDYSVDTEKLWAQLQYSY